MSTTVNTITVTGNRSGPTVVLPVLAAWHIVLALAALFGAWGGLSNGQIYGWDLTPAAPAIRSAVSLFVGVLGVLSLVAVPGILNRKGYGRAISLALNYVGFIMAAVTALQAMDVFTGIDGLAAHLQDAIFSVIALAVVVVLIGLTDRLPQGQSVARMALNVLLALAVVVMLLQLGLISGLSGLVQRLPKGLPFLVLAALFGGTAYAMFHRSTALLFRESLATREAIMGWVFLSTNMVGFLIFFAGPLLISLFLAFTQYELSSAPEWKGTANFGNILSLAVDSTDTGATADAVHPGYTRMFNVDMGGRTYVVSASDPLFWTALRNTVAWVIFILPLTIIPALALAVLVNSKLTGINIFRTLFFLPVVAGVVGVSLIWSWLYNPQLGAFNAFISGIVNSINGLAGHVVISDPKTNWLTSDQSALFSIVVMAAWMSVGNNMIIFLTGLQNIPRPLYEAARVDGATGWNAFRFITLPMLAPTTFFVITTALINAFQVFTEPYTMSLNDGYGPSNSTVTTVVYLYRQGFEANHMGYASAIAWVLVFIIFVITLIQFRISERYTNVS